MLPGGFGVSSRQTFAIQKVAGMCTSSPGFGFLCRFAIYVSKLCRIGSFLRITLQNSGFSRRARLKSLREVQFLPRAVRRAFASALFLAAALRYQVTASSKFF